MTCSRHRAGFLMLPPPCVFLTRLLALILLSCVASRPRVPQRQAERAELTAAEARLAEETHRQQEALWSENQRILAERAARVKVC